MIGPLIVIIAMAATDIEKEKAEFLEGIRRGCLSAQVAEESERLALKRQCKCLVEGVRESLSEEDYRFLLEATDQDAFLQSEAFEKMRKIGALCQAEE